MGKEQYCSEIITESKRPPVYAGSFYTGDYIGTYSIPVTQLCQGLLSRPTIDLASVLRMGTKKLCSRFSIKSMKVNPRMILAGI